VIYPVDSVTQPLNNWGQKKSGPFTGRFWLLRSSQTTPQVLINL